MLTSIHDMHAACVGLWKWTIQSDGICAASASRTSVRPCTRLPVTSPRRSRAARQRRRQGPKSISWRAPHRHLADRLHPLHVHVPASLTSRSLSRSARRAGEKRRLSAWAPDAAQCSPDELSARGKSSSRRRSPGRSARTVGLLAVRVDAAAHPPRLAEAVLRKVLHDALAAAAAVVEEDRLHVALDRRLELPRARPRPTSAT